MKSLMMIVIAASTIFIIQAVDLKAEFSANLSDNEIAIWQHEVSHGSKFGNKWSNEQKKVWEKTQEWWQRRMVGDWDNLEKLYHKDAILYHYFHKVPFNFPAYEKMMGGKSFWQVYCTVHDIRTIENVAVVMMYYEIVTGIPSKRMIFVWMKQGPDWKLVSSMNKEE
ncbi:MAG: nuclear transport factor 2 family protein [Spirochaetales bacterium]|nr:nuclear transport factor 2 family protein [Spirochaetales bacterium]